MEARSWLGLEPTHNPHRWLLPVTPGVSTGGGFLFGGCGLGAAIEALEGTTGRSVIWATAQYLSYASHPSMLDIDVTIAVAGHQITQARAVGHVADREVFTVNAALGERPFDSGGQWEQMPEVEAPEQAPPRTYRRSTEDSLMRRLDMRLARGRDITELDGTPGDGHAALWARLPEGLDISATALAILGDYVPFGVGQSLGIGAGGNSLDNTLRVCRLVPTEWVLVDVRMHAVQRGFGHGLVHLWAQDGTLLATASQSCIVRLWSPEHLAMIQEEMPT